MKKCLRRLSPLGYYGPSRDCTFWIFVWIQGTRFGYTTFKAKGYVTLTGLLNNFKRKSSIMHVHENFTRDRTLSPYVVCTHGNKFGTLAFKILPQHIFSQSRLILYTFIFTTYGQRSLMFVRFLNVSTVAICMQSDNCGQLLQAYTILGVSASSNS